MEIKNHRIPLPPTFHFLITKSRLMISRTLINRLIVLAFMVLVGFSLAKGIYSRSAMGIILALISLCAGAYFLYLLARAQQEQEETA
jgi:uncharacterized membrane protein